MTVILGILVCASLFLGGGWLGSRAENSQLRSHIATLKRQIASRAR
jgi:hypothetical protein